MGRESAVYPVRWINTARGQSMCEGLDKRSGMIAGGWLDENNQRREGEIVSTNYLN